MKVFISYRSDDSRDVTGRIYDRLCMDLQKANIFRDLDSIPLGVDFRSHLSHAVAQTDVLVAVIGPTWLTVQDQSGKPRLMSPTDFVRVEIEAALARGIPVVPLLLGDTKMPAEAELPQSLAPLAFREAISVRPDPDFHRDMDRLIEGLRATIEFLRNSVHSKETVLSAVSAKTPAEAELTDSSRAVAELQVPASQEELALVKEILAKVGWEGQCWGKLAPATRRLEESLAQRTLVVLCDFFESTSTNLEDRQKSMSIIALLLRQPSTRPFVSRALGVIDDGGLCSEDQILQKASMEALLQAPITPQERWRHLLLALNYSSERAAHLVLENVIHVTPIARRRETSLVIMQILVAARDPATVQRCCTVLRTFNSRDSIPGLIEYIQVAAVQQARHVADVLTSWRIPEAGSAIRQAIENGLFSDLYAEVGFLVKDLHMLEGSQAAQFLAKSLLEARPSVQSGMISIGLTEASDDIIVTAVNEVFARAVEKDVKRNAEDFLRKRRV